MTAVGVAAAVLTPTAAFARPRPRLRGLHATTMLQDFALVTFDVDPATLASLLPASLTPEVRTLDDGRPRRSNSTCCCRPAWRDREVSLR